MGQVTNWDRDRALREVMGFIKRSIDVHDGNGSSHSYSYWMNPENGWHLPYPETTGYLLETLVHYGKQESEYLDLAKSCAQWLTEIQNKEGWFYKGLYSSKGPSIFNTAMIAQGLMHYGKKEEAQRAYEWLTKTQKDDGTFDKYGYKGNHFPTYYTRVAWSMIDGGMQLNDGLLLKKGEQVLERLLPNLIGQEIKNAGFRLGQSASLHTVAYSLRGWMECLKLLQRHPKHIERWLDYFDNLYEKKGQWPGECFPHNFKFRCLVGEAQLALCFRSAGKTFENQDHVIDGLIKAQKIKGPATGALPGSAPFWGPYMRFKYPNWGGKFLADLLME